MSRLIAIGYRETEESPLISIDIRAPYYLFGGQKSSMEFWSLPEWQAIGVTQLAELGHTDPIFFSGWEQIGDLAREVRLFQTHFMELDYNGDAKSWFLAHLVYCHSLLIASAPPASIPQVIIG